MSDFDVHLFLNGKLSKAFAWSDHANGLHEFVIFAPSEA